MVLCYTQFELTLVALELGSISFSRVECRYLFAKEDFPYLTILRVKLKRKRLHNKKENRKIWAMLVGSVSYVTFPSALALSVDGYKTEPHLFFSQVHGPSRLLIKHSIRRCPFQTSIPFQSNVYIYSQIIPSMLSQSVFLYCFIFKDLTYGSQMILHSVQQDGYGHLLSNLEVDWCWLNYSSSLQPHFHMDKISANHLQN